MDQLRPAHDLLLDMALLEPGMRALEVACGTGLVTLRIAEQVWPEGSVYATDISGEMVTATAAQAALKGIDNVSTARADGEALDVEDATFDTAICALGLMYVVEPVNALAEMRRAVRPGGRVTVTVWGERKRCGWADIFPIVDAEVSSEVCPLFFSLGAPGALANAMTAAGLGQIEERRLPAILKFPDEDAVIEAQIDGGAVALAAKRFDQDTRQRVNTAFLESVAAYRQADGSYEIPGEFVTATGVA